MKLVLFGLLVFCLLNPAHAKPRPPAPLDRDRMCQPRGIEHLSVHLCKYASDVWQYPLRPVEPPYAEGVYASMQAFIVGMCCEKGECDLKELATYVCDLDAEYYPDEEE